MSSDSKKPGHPRSQSKKPRSEEGSESEPVMGVEAEAYTLQVFFEPEQAVFCASFLEFPELQVTDVSRAEAIYAIEDKLHSHLAGLRQSGGTVPPPVQSKETPSSLTLPISQALYRKLDTLRYQERISLEQLVTEILTAAVVRKPEPSRQQQGGGRDNNRRHSQSNHRQQGRGGGRGGRNYQETMESRENFMEYVRNLEKGGGPGYKKR